MQLMARVNVLGDDAFARLLDLDLGAGALVEPDGEGGEHATGADLVAQALAGRPVFGALLQYPGASGQVRDLRRPTDPGGRGGRPRVRLVR